MEINKISKWFGQTKNREGENLNQNGNNQKVAGGDCKPDIDKKDNDQNQKTRRESISAYFIKVWV